ncbi:Aluminum-activated malate transporter 14 [Spatholobus suberectus]|nr:Aluminum-activated malate transporter 14 [Spatholobus suberectus]
MESTHVIVITNVEENIAHAKENKTFKFRLPPIFSQLGENEVHWSLVSITSNLRDKQMQSEHDARKMIHCIKVGISLVLVSLLYLLNPLFEQVGENAMWAIMTVVVMFEFSAGATLGKGFNRGLGTIIGGGLGCFAAFFAQSIGIGRVGNSIIIGASVFIIGSVATYLRLVPSIKKRYDYGVTIFLLTFNLVLVSGVRAHTKVWEIARQRILNILMGFIVCVCVNLFVFPLWASDELHDSIVSRFLDLANTIQGCIGECPKIVSEKENQPHASFNDCKTVLNSKSKDESLANFAKWEPWHRKFGFSYPWGRYLKIGEVLRELAAFILAVGRCLEASQEPMASLRESQSVQLERYEAVESRIVCILRELGESMKQMRKCDANASISAKLKAARGDLSLIISTSKMVELEGAQVLTIASFVFLLMEVVGKVEELVKEVEELGDTAGFRTPTTPMSS